MACPQGSVVTMRIAMLSDLETQGGAAIAASRLATALSDAEHEVVRLIGWPEGRSHPWTTVAIPSRTLGHRVARKLRPARVRDRLVHLAAKRALSQHLHQMRPDVINIPT